jgi:two-component system chemotaxis response regulator CheB
LEAALWTAYRALEERAALCRRLAEQARARHADISARHFRVDADEVAGQASVLRALLWSRVRDEDPNPAPGGSET